ncbi:PAS domain S-box-containing protein [Bradyrhizobium ottawaense]
MVTSREFGKTRLPLWAAGFVGLICVTILGLSAWREWEARNVDLRNAEIDVTNLAHSLIQHADDTFELVDTLLVGLVHRLELDGTGPDTITKLQAYLPTRKSSDRIRGIFVYDATGRWLATTERLDFSKLNNSDREYFQRHRDSTETGTLIGPPIKSRSGGQWIITASRRINDPDGGFAGVALLTIDVSYFVKFYERFDLGPNGSASLLNNGGIMLARSRDESDAFIGRDLSNAPLFKGWKSRPAEAVYYFKSPLDGVQRLSYYQRSSRYPLMVLASKSQDDVLAPWRRAAATRITFVVGLVLLIAVIGSYLVRQLWQRQRMAQALVAKEANFRLLAEQSSDMVTRIGLDNRLLYVSPSCVRITGWTAEELLNTSALAGIHADDMERVAQAITALKNGEAEEARFVYRQRHREKGEIWAEAALHVTVASDSGAIDGVVAVVRDMTEQKDLQDKLASLARTDGLTGLANRRAFDERLADEWARARRDGTQLSLLLIDVDHFKKFNDHYGHLAGRRVPARAGPDPVHPGQASRRPRGALRRRGIRRVVAEHRSGWLRGGRGSGSPGAARSCHAACAESALPVGHGERRRGNRTSVPDLHGLQHAGRCGRPRALCREGQRPRSAGDVRTGRALAREDRVTGSNAHQP